MGGRFGTRVLYGAALAALVMTPRPAHADIWCEIFNVGCGGGSTAQSSTERDAPEIDPAAVANGIALAMGGAAILRGRRRR